VCRNVLSFDVEDWYHCLDPEPGNWSQYEDRITRSVEAVLEILERSATRATFFVLGHVARRHDDLVRRIDAGGHEIASHGTEHRFIYRQSPLEFEADVRAASSLLADITGKGVAGYRAPYFSITAQSRWALGVLGKSGIQYDSSIFPVLNHRYGIPDAPRLPHRTAEGLMEMPLSTYRLGSFNIPCGGGVYFRLLPYRLLRSMFRQLNQRGEPIIFYLHPWELDPDQPRIRLPGALALRHYWALGRTAARLTQLLQDFRFGTMQEALCL
jgi:polysaccharide deacetylase family protein (PEP-CTERM system associated)